MYQMVIISTNPDRYLPPSWDFEKKPGMGVWETALDIAKDETVAVVRIVDEKGRNVPRDQ